MAPYRVEMSKTARAGCQNSECKKAGVKIQKGELRMGVQVDFDGNQSWQWKHWVIVNVKEEIEDNLEYLDGLDELPDDMQAKVRTALEQGHVDDEDWKGDMEKNRPGENGYRVKSPKKTPKKGGNEEEVQEEATPSKPAPKKRGRGKDQAEASDQEDPKPAAKKARSKAANVKREGDDVDAPEPAPKKTRVRKPVKYEDVDEGEEVSERAPKKAKVGPKKAKVEVQAANGDDVEPAPKKARSRPKTAAKPVESTRPDTSELEPTEANGAEVEEPEPEPAKPKRTRKTAADAKATKESKAKAKKK